MGVLENGLIVLLGTLALVSVVYWVIRLAVRNAILDARYRLDREQARSDARQARLRESDHDI